MYRRCGDPAKLQCPKCLELKMPKAASAFCSQDCFKTAWTEHKCLHKATADSYMYVMNSGRTRSLHIPNYAWTGELQPERYAPATSSLGRFTLVQD
jgi:methionyl aminopeptidase